MDFVSVGFNELRARINSARSTVSDKDDGTKHVHKEKKHMVRGT